MTAYDEEYTEVLSLTANKAYAWSREYTETLSLTDGDNQESVQVSPNGGYIAITSEESSLIDAVDEVIKLLEEQGCPQSQTQITMAHDGTNFAVVAIVKRH